jgi:hypothetical protein
MKKEEKVKKPKKIKEVARAKKVRIFYGQRAAIVSLDTWLKSNKENLFNILFPDVLQGNGFEIEVKEEVNKGKIILFPYIGHSISYEFDYEMITTKY